MVGSRVIYGTHKRSSVERYIFFKNAVSREFSKV